VAAKAGSAVFKNSFLDFVDEKQLVVHDMVAALNVDS
jgi:hypothetical protein